MHVRHAFNTQLQESNLSQQQHSLPTARDSYSPIQHPQQHVEDCFVRLPYRRSIGHFTASSCTSICASHSSRRSSDWPVGWRHGVETEQDCCHCLRRRVSIQVHCQGDRRIVSRTYRVVSVCNVSSFRISLSQPPFLLDLQLASFLTGDLFQLHALITAISCAMFSLSSQFDPLKSMAAFALLAMRGLKLKDNLKFDTLQDNALQAVLTVALTVIAFVDL